MKYYSVTKSHRLPGAFSNRSHTSTDFYIRFEDIPERDRQIAVAHEFECLQFPVPAFQFFHQEFDIDASLTCLFVNNYTDEEIVLA